MPRQLPTLAVPVLASALVLAGGVGVAIVAGEDDPARSATSTSEQNLASETDSATEPSGASIAYPDGDIFGVCGVARDFAVPGTPDATLALSASGEYPDARARPAVRRAVARVAAVVPQKVECFDNDHIGGAEPVEPLRPQPAATEDDAAAVDFDSPTGSSDQPPAGFGHCAVSWTPAVAIPEGATIDAHLSGNYSRAEQVDAVRAAMVERSGRPADEIECDFVVPPIGYCHVEIPPHPDAPVPGGADATGGVSGSYSAADQRDGLKAAIAAMAGVPVDAVVCEDGPVVAEQGLPGDAPVASGPEPAPIDDPTP